MPVYNQPVEVYGEPVFYSKLYGESTMQNILPMTSRDAQIATGGLDANAAVQYWSDIRDQYEPALKVHSYRLINQMDRLITCNLRLRMLDKLREM